MRKITAVLLGIIAVLCFALHPVEAQRLVRTSLSGTMTPASVNERMRSVFTEAAPPAATADIDLIKITYTSTDQAGRPATLSGLVAMPRGGAPRGLVVFNHGTIFDRRRSPSRWKGARDDSEAETATLAFASGGYAVAMPDYIGLGDHVGTHPYPLNVVNARSAVDIIGAARSLAARQNYQLGNRLFVTGYSEGGGVAMALTKELESMPGSAYRVTAAAPASGSYDLTGATLDFLLRPTGAPEGFVIRLYLLSYSAFSFHKNNGAKLTDYFKPAMSFSIAQNYKRTLTDEDLIKRLAVTSALMRANNSLRNVLTDRFVRVMEAKDTSDPVIRELAANNVYDWAPRTPMLLINLEGDTIVDPANTDNALRAMRARGVPAANLQHRVIRNPQLNHITAVPTALAHARAYFDNQPR
ncbi:MAG: hypothetical protein H0V76_05130 [Blastocatellia bacterium]|nr:hypothetical protein [Blastocatellia bacterium]